MPPCHCLLLAQGLPDGIALAAGSQAGDTQSTVFVTGLLAGCVTFGGAFTAVPCAPTSRVHFALCATARVRSDACVCVSRGAGTSSARWSRFRASSRRSRRALCACTLRRPCVPLTLTLRAPHSFWTASPSSTSCPRRWSCSSHGACAGRAARAVCVRRRQRAHAASAFAGTASWRMASLAPF